MFSEKIDASRLDTVSVATNLGMLVRALKAVIEHIIDANAPIADLRAEFPETAHHIENRDVGRHRIGFSNSSIQLGHPGRWPRGLPPGICRPAREE